jgi:outer membrane lipoprotein-sorting protein
MNTGDLLVRSRILKSYLSLAIGVLVLLMLNGRLHSQEKEGPGAEPRRLSEAELKDFLGRLEKNLADLKSLKTNFIQERHLSIFSDVVESKGVLLFVSPDKVRFEITEPFRSVMIANHKSVAKYELVEGKWKKLKLGSPDIILAVTGEIATWLKGRFGEKKDFYEIHAVGGKSVTIVLTPKNEEMKKHISSMELAVAENEKSIMFVVIRERGEDFTKIIFSGERVNESIPGKYFDTQGQEPVRLEKKDRGVSEDNGKEKTGRKKKPGEGSADKTGETR